MFEICNFLIDKNINIIAETIIEKINYNDINIYESINYLKLFSTSICDIQFKKLLFIILNKYNLEEIIYEINKLDKNSISYKLCIHELAKYTINNIKKNIIY